MEDGRCSENTPANFEDRIGNEEPVRTGLPFTGLEGSLKRLKGMSETIPAGRMSVVRYKVGELAEKQGRVMRTDLVEWLEEAQWMIILCYDWRCTRYCPSIWYKGFEVSNGWPFG